MHSTQNTMLVRNLDWKGSAAQRWLRSSTNEDIRSPNDQVLWPHLTRLLAAR